MVKVLSGGENSRKLFDKRLNRRHPNYSKRSSSWNSTNLCSLFFAEVFTCDFYCQDCGSCGHFRKWSVHTGSREDKYWWERTSSKCSTGSWCWRWNTWWTRRWSTWWTWWTWSIYEEWLRVLLLANTVFSLFPEHG